MENTRTLAQLVFRVFVRPAFPLLQWLGKKSGRFIEAKTVEGPHRRQPYLIGFLDEGASVEALAAQLSANGFFLERMAYPDPGQALSMRKLDDAKPDHQYHVRVFSDGEIRGHYELTPEDHPFGHMDERVFEPRAGEFKRALRGLLRPAEAGDIGI